MKPTKHEITGAAVVKSNQIIEAKYRLTTRAQKFILYMASKISTSDTSFKYIKVSVQEIESVLHSENTKWGDIYSVVQDIIISLNKNPLKIVQADGSKVLINWIASANLPQGQGVVEFEFSDLLHPYLLQLKTHFTQYKLNNVLQLRSSFAIRLYELLKAHQFIGRAEYELEELKDILGIEDKYPLYYDLKRRVINVAQKELLAHSDICFDFHEKRISRKITKVVFLIDENKEVVAKMEAEFPSSSEPVKKKENPLLQSLVDLGFSKMKAEELLSLGFEVLANADVKAQVSKEYKKSDVYFAEKIELTNYEAKRKKILNPVGFFLKAIQENFKSVHFERNKMGSKPPKPELVIAPPSPKPKKQNPDNEQDIKTQYESLYDTQVKLLMQQQQVIVNQIIQTKPQVFAQILQTQGISQEDYYGNSAKRAKVNIVIIREYKINFTHLDALQESVNTLRSQIKALNKK